MFGIVQNVFSLQFSDVLMVIGENISYDDDELAAMQFIDFSTDPPRYSHLDFQFEHYFLARTFLK